MDYLQAFTIKDVAQTTTTRKLDPRKPSHGVDILKTGKIIYQYIDKRW